MPYQVHYLDTDFVIKRDNFSDCIKLIEQYHKALVPDIECPGGALAYPEKDIGKKLVYALSHFGWSTELDESGIWGIEYGNDRRGDINVLKVISEYVESGSVIEYIGEDGKATKVEFNDGSLRIFEGQISYKEINLTN